MASPLAGGSSATPTDSDQARRRAAATVDPATVVFGPAEVAPVHYALEDVDGDGDIDMILHFITQELGLGADSTEAVLTGQTYDEMEIAGTDAVRIVPAAVKAMSKGKGKK